MTMQPADGTLGAGDAVGGAVAVVGSANLDVVVPVQRHPRLGETVIGGDHAQVPGGKGANQAVAAARLGAATRFVGRVGDDDPGRLLRSSLEADAVDVAGLGTDDQAPSGIALIVVAPDGENTIVVSPGANARLEPTHVDRAGALVSEAAAVLVQLEVPIPTVEAAVEAATGIVVCNPAPAATLPPAVLRRVDVLVPNRSELAVLAGAETEPRSLEEVVALARQLEGPRAVVVTLGSDGALVLDGADVVEVAPVTVDAIDATAAGDAFCAALTVRLVAGDALADAARYANAAAGLATTRPGAQPSLPSAVEVATVLGPAWEVDPNGP